METFALSGLINGLIVLSLGVFVIRYNWRSKINQLYFLIVIAVVIWSLGYWQWLSSDDSVSALFWIRILSIGSTLIPVFYFHWVVSLLGLNKQQKNIIRWVYSIAALFLFFSFSDLFIKGVKETLFFPFWPKPGILYHFYLAFTYILLVVYSLFLLWKNYKASSGERKAQIIYVVIGSIIAFGGGLSNFFLWYDIPIPPYGNFLVALYPFFFGYAIVKHRLFDVKVIATQMLVFAIWIFLIIRTILSESYQDFAINGVLLVAVVFVGILLIRSVLKEVEQREEMEEMTKKIEKAYVIEKRANEELKELDEARNQFTMATQHHLRTPLTAMVGYMDLILGGTYGKVSAKLKKPIARFQSSTNRLLRIVNSLLDVSQFQLGREVVSLQPGVELDPILKELFEELKFEAELKHISFKLKRPKKILKVRADSEKLKVALFNLVDNGLKYTGKGGVTVNVENKKDKVRIIVKDTGMGIAKEDIENIFSHQFERGKDAKRIFAKGKGIGLYVTYQIIKAHKGKLWVISEGKGKGSTFCLEIPASK